MCAAVLNPTPESLESPVKPVFARHETFHPRYGWLKKAVDKVQEYPNLFLEPDAPVTLGVGKNMVAAIRYWANAFKLVEESADANAGFKITDFGNLLLADNGFDPFIEDTGTLWLLHWYLLKPTCIATAWYHLFNVFSHATFSVDDVLRSLKHYKDEHFPTAKAVDASLKKDLMCILRMYSNARAEGKQVKEEGIDSPFRDLGLIQPLRGPFYQFNLGAKPSLHPLIVAYVCLDFAQERQMQTTINISTLLQAMGCPGYVFKLSEPALYEALESVLAIEPRLQLSEAAGLSQLSFHDDLSSLKYDLLHKYYSRG